MATSATSVRVVLGTPALQLSGGLLTLRIPVLNAGDVALGTFACTDIRLGAAVRTSPPAVPLPLGTVGPRNNVTVLAKFTGATTGSRLLLTLRGSYLVNGVSYGLTLNRYVTVPAESVPTLPTLRARLQATTGNAQWNYTVINEEAATSSQRVASVSLQVAAPVTVTGTPPGWRAETDNATYVLWVSDDFAPPYPTHVAPGQSLSGFQITCPRPASEAGPYSLVAWNHAADDAGLVVAEYTLTPHR
ncbi:hypothetical protein [Aquabacterium sp. OR-4]|uniref:hypothetical protein n=1 Tax=Aquabacterium sp. OR-4 TaxID=2978127 RepID=UPI0028C71CCF|nr:hypothetical protein [Aquabacterium sp. OR-4]MDT7838908.1 hypothetical protein [Aquabacterium sp. OR-4]